MLPRRPRHQAASRLVPAVLIIGHARHGDAEGVIDHVRRLADRVEASVLLSDGRQAIARVAIDEWDWLELRAGDIVSVGPLLDLVVSV